MLAVEIMMGKMAWKAARENERSTKMIRAGAPVGYQWLN
jgi:hypothetical protein